MEKKRNQSTKARSQLLNAMNPFLFVLLILADHLLPAVRAFGRIIVLLIQREYEKHALMKRLEERQALLRILFEMKSLEGETQTLVRDMAVLDAATADVARRERMRMRLMRRALQIKGKVGALKRRARMVDAGPKRPVIV